MADAADLIRMEVRGLIQDPSTKTPIVLLRSAEGEEFLPIWIGAFEANAIALALQGISAPRPLTHDLLQAVLAAVGVVVEKVVVSGLRDNTFFATLQLLAASGPLELDARPSDAIALALRCSAPIFVQRGILDAAMLHEPDKGSDEDRLRKWLEELPSEDLGRYKM